jgi:C-terminal processing protease CtpA/Prc
MICLLAGFSQLACKGQLSREVKEKIVSGVADSLTLYYTNPDTAVKMGAFVRSRLENHAYDTITSPRVFAEQLTRDLRSVYKDLHMSVAYTAELEKNRDQNQGVSDQAAEFMLNLRKRMNLGFTKTEMLKGNIGYIEISVLASPDDEAKNAARLALGQVSNSDYLIIDLRKCMGGSPRMVAYLCGFLFRDTVHLNDLYTRYTNSLIVVRTSPDSSFPKLNTIPVYILTSKTTFSGGEEFAYDLKNQKRAVIIGETTGGAAHPVGPWALGNGFVINIPFARAINPVTLTDWEGTGVEPDLPVPAAAALETALEWIRDGR